MNQNLIEKKKITKCGFYFLSLISRENMGILKREVEGSGIPPTYRYMFYFKTLHYLLLISVLFPTVLSGIQNESFIGSS